MKARPRLWYRRVVWTLALSILPTMAGAQVPSFEEVTGFALGERITLHHQMVRYVEALARTSPNVQVQWIGHTYERNPIPLVFISAPENLARLDAIQEVAARLGDPRGLSASEEARLRENQPTVVWLGGSIHGFELSGSEGLLKVLERLTLQDDAETREILRSTLILMDPILNPDGRDAHARHNHENIGRIVASDRRDWSNDFTPWEGLKYRTSHYFHDMNRDWFLHTHPEIRARVATVRQWRPQVLVDAHEMGPDVEFFFDPPTGPWGAYFPDFARRGFDLFYEGYVAAFDRAGFEYMSGERYNYFYPGYTTAWGSYQGAVGMLYEQGSTRGLAMTRADGSVRTLRDALDQQYTATWSALLTSARNRTALLTGYVEAHREAIADGDRGVRRYLFPADGGDPYLLEVLMEALDRNGIEVRVLDAPARLRGLRDRTGAPATDREFPAGTWVIEAAQPRNRMIRALFEPDSPVPQEFLDEARILVDRGENPRFYDVTGYSLPLYFNVQAFGSTDTATLPARRWDREAPRSVPSLPRAGYAYLLDGADSRSLTVLMHLRLKGYRAAVSTVPLTVGGERLPTGTVVVRTGQNPESLHDDLADLVRQYPLRVRAVDSGATDTVVPALGSADVLPVRTPSVALVAEGPVNGTSFGFAWHALDQFYHLPHTVLRAGSLATLDLRDFNVLILPEVSAAALATLLGPSGIDRIRRWVQDGGTLIALGSAVDFVRGPLGLLSLVSWYDTAEGQGAAAIEVPGAFFRGTLDRRSWLSAGIPDGDFPLQLRSSRIYLDPGLPPSAGRRRIGAFPSEDAHLSGHAWDESQARIPGSVFAWEERQGSGRVIAFSEDVNFRGHSRGSQRLFLNAVVLGPTAP
jgi:hypothetical protein